MDLLDNSKKANQKATIFMKTTPFFSIIIPVFRAKDYISRCIESCINQTFQDIEIIAIDDCGQDETIEIVKNYAKQDQRIAILYNPTNLGAFHSRIQGIECAKGQYCLFVDCDDFIALNALEILYQTIQKNPSDLIHFRFSYFPNTLLKPSPRIKNSFLQNSPTIQAINANTTFQSICDKAFKSNYAKLVAKKLSFIQKPFSCMEDGLFFLVTSFEIQTYIGLDKILYFYQNNSQSTTKLINQNAFETKLKDFQNGLEILQTVKILYPQHLKTIQQYEKKVISAYILEGRKYAEQELNSILKIISSCNFTKKPFSLQSTYLKSTLLSLRYFYRWQTVIRVFIYILTLGIIKI